MGTQSAKQTPATSVTKGHGQSRKHPDRKTAMLLCAVLGGLGAHRFYLGQKGLGALYVVFSWTFVPLIASWIDLAFLAAQDDEDFVEEQREAPILQPLVFEGRVRRNERPLREARRA